MSRLAISLKPTVEKRFNSSPVDFEVLLLNTFPYDALYKDDHRIEIIEDIESDKIVQHDCMMMTFFISS
jgi:hypothetical protein